MKQIHSTLINDAHFVYCGFAEEAGSVYVKVGISVRPVSRARQIQCGAPFEIKRFVFCMIGRQSAALKFERLVADALKEHRTRGEWYRFDPAFAKVFRETVADAYRRASTRGLRLKWKELAWNEYHGNPLWRLDKAQKTG